MSLLFAVATVEGQNLAVGVEKNKITMRMVILQLIEME
jgi:hypothetical protein